MLSLATMVIIFQRCTDGNKRLSLITRPANAARKCVPHHFNTFLFQGKLITAHDAKGVEKKRKKKKIF